MSAHSEYDAYSSSTPSHAGTADHRARDALDRERERLERLRLHDQEGGTTPTRGAGGGGGGGRAREDSADDADAEVEEEEEEEGERDGEGLEEGEEEGGIMGTVVLPVLDSVRLSRSLVLPFLEISLIVLPCAQIHDRITNPAARASILRFRAAIKQVEREVPGFVNVFVSEVVDSCEVRQPCPFLSLSFLLVQGTMLMVETIYEHSLSRKATRRNLPPSFPSHTTAAVSLAYASSALIPPSSRLSIATSPSHTHPSLVHTTPSSFSPFLSPLVRPSSLCFCHPFFRIALLLLCRQPSAPPFRGSRRRRRRFLTGSVLQP